MKGRVLGPHPGHPDRHREDAVRVRVAGSRVRATRFQARAGHAGPLPVLLHDLVRVHRRHLLRHHVRHAPHTRKMRELICISERVFFSAFEQC